MLVKYLRDFNGRKFGAVVAISPTQIGYSVLHDDDMHLIDSRNYQFNKEEAVSRAVEKAKLGYDHWLGVYKQKVMKRFLLTEKEWSSPSYMEGLLPLINAAFPKLSYVMDELYVMRCRASRVTNPKIFDIPETH